MDLILNSLADSTLARRADGLHMFSELSTQWCVRICCVFVAPLDSDKQKVKVGNTLHAFLHKGLCNWLNNE